MEDSDWLIGQLRGQQGVVPVNLITEVTDPQEIKRYRTEFSSAPHPHRQQANGQADGLSMYLLFVCLFVCLCLVYIYVLFRRLDR